MKRKFDPGSAVEGDNESRRESTMTDEHEKAKRRKTRTEAQTGTADAEDPFFRESTMPTLREPSLRAATAGKSVLRPERSSHTTTTPNPFGNPMNPAFDANPSSDDGDKATLQGVDRSIKQIEHTGRQVVTTLKERGDKYKQLLLEKQKRVSDLRLETAEGARELTEARMVINTHKEGWQNEQKQKVVTTLKERGDKYKQLLLEKQKQVSDLRLEKAEGARELAEARMRINTLEHKNRQEKEKIAELVKAVEKVESRWRLW